MDSPNPANLPHPAHRLLITAGPTVEPIDAVRYMSNRSSGRMGVALAEAAVERGLQTTLLLGPVPTPPPDHSNLRVHRFQTAADLRELLARHWPDHDVLIMAAAVADFRPADADLGAKIPRQGARLVLELVRTPDLLGELADLSRPDQIRVGFALEPPARLLESARGKLARKRLHAVVANPLDTMDAEDVAATVLLASGETLRPPSGGGSAEMSKAAFAAWLIDQLPLITAQAAPSAG